MTVYHKVETKQTSKVKLHIDMLNWSENWFYLQFPQMCMSDNAIQHFFCCHIKTIIINNFISINRSGHFQAIILKHTHGYNNLF